MLKKQKKQVIAILVAMFVLAGFSGVDADQKKMDMKKSSGMVYTITQRSGQTIYDIQGTYYYLSNDRRMIGEGSTDVVPGQKVFVLYRVEDGKNIIFKIFNENDDMPGMLR